jgi:hypothetical protein
MLWLSSISTTSAKILAAQTLDISQEMNVGQTHLCLITALNIFIRSLSYKMTVKKMTSNKSKTTVWKKIAISPPA